MKKRIVIFIAAIVTTAVWSLVLLWWLNRPMPTYVFASVPGMDNVPSSSRVEKKIKIITYFKQFLTEFSKDYVGEWRQFRGNTRDNICRDSIRLADKWPEAGPKIVWRQPLGEGHAGAAISKGKVYVLDYLDNEKADALRCFSLHDGKELWRRWYVIDIKRNHGRSRTVPSVDENSVVTIGPKGQVMAVNPNDGTLLWTIDMSADFGAVIPQWYTGQCPLIDNGTVILAPAGDSLLIGVDSLTGKIKWKTPNPLGLKMSHSSVMPMNLWGKKMYVYSALGGIVGVSAENENCGTILWQSNIWSPPVAAPSPLGLQDNKIFVCAGYGYGGALLQVKYGTNEQFSLEILQRYEPRSGLSLEQQTPILFNNVIYGIRPKDAGSGRGQLQGALPDNPQQQVYGSGAELRFGLGPFLIADDKFFILDDTGILTMLKIIDGKTKILGRQQIIKGQDAWGPLALADGRMVLRDIDQMVCVDLR